MSLKEPLSPPPPARADTGAAPCPWLDPGVDGAALRVGDFPSLLLLRLAAAIQRNLMPRYTHRFGLSLPEWRVLPLLARNSPMQLSDLTARSTLDKALVSRAVRLLQGKGYTTIVGDPEHGRRLMVSITDSGRALHDRVLPAARECQMALLSVLDDDERESLYGIIRKLSAAMEAAPQPREATPAVHADLARPEP